MLASVSLSLPSLSASSSTGYTVCNLFTVSFKLYVLIMFYNNMKYFAPIMKHIFICAFEL